MKRAPGAGARCSVCAHGARARIETALRTGRTLVAVAKAFDLSKSALARHRKHIMLAPRVRADRSTLEGVASSPHAVPPATASVAPARTPPRPRTTEEMCAELERIVQDQVIRLHTSGGDLSEVERVKIAGLAVQHLTHLAKLQGRTELSEQRILRSAQWRRVREVLVQTIATKWPDALLAVGEALAKLGEEQGSS